MERPLSPFLRVASWGGWFGNFRWINSRTDPHYDHYSQRLVTTWGGCDLGDTPPGVMLPFTEVFPLKPVTE